jgi:3-hydroxymyristoyl/3-hydroxydecanoyl-(acyl carrier protein) dehydratase
LPDGLPQSAPFRFVDRLIESDPPRRCVTVKVFSADEVLLESAGRVPGGMILEALCQAAAFLPGSPEAAGGRIVRIDEAEILREVAPGDRLVATAVLLEESAAALKAECRGEVDGRLVARLKVLIGRDGK